MANPITLKSIVLEGTSHDVHRTIVLTSECDGVRIEKETDQGRGDITLTVLELNQILNHIDTHFNQRDDI